mmetsp:Transcript_16778/g.15127  ORF Transcript_16778/g.15127 Transcript_16778/m.15127 type:complete len:442 (+) Transcript_16778:2-1327(+)
MLLNSYSRLARRIYKLNISIRFNTNDSNTNKINDNINQERRRKSQNNSRSDSSNNSAISSASVIYISSFAAAVYLVYDINNPNGYFYESYQQSPVNKYFKSIYDFLFNAVSDVFQPAQDKILPDWADPLIYGEIPPGTPAPPLLVLDLEKTLIGSVYDAANGWRHVKRPGVDKLIESLTQYYEIAIFSENDALPEEVWTAIDKDRRCHRITSVGGELRNHRVLKRLDKMNRDINRIILIDDNEITSQLHLQNTIIVPPYDINNPSDRILLDLIPFLQAFLHEGIDNLPEAIDNLGTHNAEDLVVEYSMRLTQKKIEDNIKRNRGLGGIIRKKKVDTSDLSDLVANQTSILSAKQIVGGGPIVLTNDVKKSTSDNPLVPKVGYQPNDKPVDKQGKLLNFIESALNEKEIAERKRKEEMNRLYMQMQIDKQKKLEEEKRKQLQ